MTVSIPEKTLEHWASMYLTYRYRSKAGLWWPTSGVDVAVEALPARGSGKALNLEIKSSTPTVPGGSRHVVQIRLEQLERYALGTVPVYYVLPKPGWLGSLGSGTAWPGRPAGIPDPSELGFSRVDRRFLAWFANWMYVLPDRRLYRALLPTITAARIARTLTSRTEAPLYTHDAAAPGPAVWDAALAGRLSDANLVPWQEFWTRVEECGSWRLPAVYYVRAAAAPSVTRRALVRSLEAEKLQRADGDDAADLLPIQPFVPIGRSDEQWNRESARYAAYRGEPEPEYAEEGAGGSHAISVFLGIDALSPD